MLRNALRSLATSMLAASAILAVGCIKESDDVTVKADGAGSYSATMSIDLSAMKGIEDAFKGPKDPAAMGEATPPDKSKEEDPLEKLKKQWKGIDGLEVTKAVKEEKDGKVTVTVEAKFTSLEVYARATGQEMSTDLKKNDDGSYTLKFFDPDEAPPADAAMGDAPAMGDDMGAAMVMPMLEPFLKDLEITRKLTLPGKIVETNGTKSDDGSTVTWKITFADLKKADGKLPAQTVTFKGDDIDWKPFTVKREHEGRGGPGGPGGPGGAGPK